MAMEWQNLLSVRRFKSSKPPSTVPGDRRTEFDRDFDRVIYSTPFRRLQDKTQVFPLEPNDSVRTRLTHSLEVSATARGAAKTTCARLLEDGLIDSRTAEDIEVIAATCGLLHDLGNPPFGHSGELAIQEWCKARQETLCGSQRRDPKDPRPLAQDSQYARDFLKFEGNAQTLRLVTRLQILADFHGLNLTCGTLSAACKYIAASDAIDPSMHEKSKVGHFASENALVRELRAETGTSEARNPITFLVEAADDCVYNTVDIEDGLTKGILDWGFFKEELTKVGGDDPAIQNSIQWAEGRVRDAQVALVGREKGVALVQYFRVRAIGNIVIAAAEAFRSHYQEIMNGAYHGELVMDSSARALLEGLKKINRAHVYCSSETLRLELMGRKVIEDLLEIYWEGVAEGTDCAPGAFPGKAFHLLSHNYRAAFWHALEKEELPETYCRMQLVTDYVCGMTDTFAVALHRRLTNG